MTTAGGHDIYLDNVIEGGYAFPRSGRIGRELRSCLKRLMAKHGHQELTPIYLENGVYNFYLEGVKQDASALEQVWATSGPHPNSRQAFRP
eukprot:6323787-Amphidinium_carterae.2